MKSKLLPVALILMCFNTTPVFAQLETGDQLLRMLTGQDSNEVKALMDRTYSAGYVSGTIDSYMTLSDANPSARSICFPKQGISNAQAIQIIIKWQKEHPERLHEAARTNVLEALRTAFPCPR
jgi:hypothetical protein